MISIEGVSKSFKGNIAIQDLTLRVEAGEIFGLLGANGAGKSTTINMLLGFTSPEKGKVLVDSIDVLNHADKARKITGYIPENVNLYPYLSGYENLDYFCRLAGLKYPTSKLEGYLEKCGLDRAAFRRKVKEYSKGMRQKVGIAIAYAKNAKVYLLDEPASGLDPLASNELSELLKDLASQGAAILMASHDIFRVREVCHRIGILKNGELVSELQSDEVNAKELEDLYLKYMQN